MNHIQRAWLYVLRPFSYLINEKLAQRSGLLGKIGKFFLIGPREFGFHPSNRFLIFMNGVTLEYLAFLMHRYSIIKGLTHNGYSMMRLFRLAAFLPTISGLAMIVFLPNLSGYYDIEDGTTLQTLASHQKIVPTNALNHRLSAHYTQIDAIYMTQMIKKYIAVKHRIIQERSKLSEEQKKTRYARPGYVYVKKSSQPDGK